MLRPETDYSFPLLARGVGDIIAHGGYGAIGSHGQHHGLGSHWETWSAAAGMGNMGALEMATAHGAHFQSMGYTGAAPTIAELLSAAGFHTESVTRNPIFDGAIPGITRGFRARTCLLAEVGGLNPLSLLLALSKPRFRRRRSGRARAAPSPWPPTIPGPRRRSAAACRRRRATTRQWHGCASWWPPLPSCA